MKQSFVASLQRALDEPPAELRDRLVLSGDYNVIHRTRRPLHPGVLPCEFGLLEALEGHGLVGAHEQCPPGEQAYSWIGRTGDGYRYDYFHIGRELAEHIAGCGYLHETREQRLTNHAAVELRLAMDQVSRLETSDPAEEEAATLFQAATKAARTRES